MVRFFQVLLVGLVGVLTGGNTAQAAAYAFSQGNGRVTFHNKASLHEFDGSAGSFSGTFDSTAGTGQMTINAGSLTTNLGPRDKKMHSFCMESSSYATIKFAVTSVGGDTAGLASGEGTGKITLNGQLTIRSVSKSVAVAATYTFEEGKLRLKGRYNMKWGDYGVPDPSIVISKLYPDMYVRFNVSMTPQ